MSKYSSKDIGFLLFDGYNVLSLSTTLGDDIEAVLEEITALGDTWPSQADTGTRKGTFQTDGFYDDTTGSINDMLSGNQGVSRVVCYGMASNAVGKSFRGLAGAVEAKYTRTVTLQKFHRAKGDWTVSGQVDAGLILHPHQAETADGNTQSTPVDNTASSANGGAAYLQVSTITLGTATNLAAKVRHSADNVTYADLVTFTVATARTAQRSAVSVGTTINRYLASSWAWTGGAGGGSTATFMIGFARS